MVINRGFIINQGSGAMGWLSNASNRTRLAVLAAVSAGVSALTLQLVSTLAPMPVPLLLLLNALMTGALTLAGYRATHRSMVAWQKTSPEALLANPKAIAQIATEDDELGALLQVFEGLLEQIEHQDKVMQAYNEELEMHTHASMSEAILIQITYTFLICLSRVSQTGS